MSAENFEQLSAGEAAVGDAAKWLKDGIVCIITLWNGVPLRGDAAAAHRPQGGRDRSGPEGRHRHRRPEARQARDRRRRCACRCSSTKAKCCASIRAPGEYISRGKRLTAAALASDEGRPVPAFRISAQRCDEDLRERFEAARVGASKRASCGLSRSSTPSSSPPRISGITISEFEAESQAMCPGNACTSSTSTVSRRAAAVPQTPLPMRDAHAGGLALEGPQHQFATLI